MEFWLGNKSLDRHACLAVHGLGEAGFTEVANRTRELLVATGHVNPNIQLLPEDKWIRDSLKRLIKDNFLKKRKSGHTLYSPARKIYEGWP